MACKRIWSPVVFDVHIFPSINKLVAFTRSNGQLRKKTARRNTLKNEDFLQPNTCQLVQARESMLKI